MGSEMCIRDSATSSIAWAAGTALQESLKSIIIVSVAATTVLGSLDDVVVAVLPGILAYEVGAMSTSGSLGRTYTTPGVALT